MPLMISRRTLVAISIAVLAVISMLLVGAQIDPRQVVAGDGHYILAAARSLAYDGDLDLTNQYRVMGDRWGLGLDPSRDGWRLPAREIGASLAMVPGLWLHHALGLDPDWEPRCACLIAAASLGLCWLGCTRAIENSSSSASGVTAECLAGAAVLGFVVPFYAIGSAGYSHAIDATIGSWLCAAMLERSPSASTRGTRKLGMLLACAVLVRLQNLLWLVRPHAPRRWLACAALASLGLLPQLWLGLRHPGSERGSLGWTLAFFDLHDLPSDLARVLLGVHGLLSWTPIIALALLGLALAVAHPRDDDEREQARGLALVCAAMWLLLACVRDVDGGDAFGARRMAGLVGVWAVGLGWLWSRVGEWRRRWRPALAAAMLLLVAINLVRTQQAITGTLSLRSPHHVRTVR